MKINKNKIQKAQYPYSSPLDEYEQELEDFTNKGKFVPMPKKQFEKYKIELQEAAKRHIENRQSITIRVKKQVVNKIKEKSLKNGIPYQTTINVLLGQYADGKIDLAI